MKLSEFPKKTQKKILALRDIIWTTRDGEKNKIRDMQTSHIENCIKQLHRHGHISATNYIKMKKQRVKEKYLKMLKPTKTIDAFELELKIRNHINKKIDNLLEFAWMDLIG